MGKLAILRKMMFALPLSEANFDVRGFQENELSRKRLEEVAKTVVCGYNTALETGLSDDLLVNRIMIKNELSGFFNEGIGMGLYTLDLFSPLKGNRFWNFIKVAGKNHEYMSYIGAGIACGVFFNRPFKKFLDKASPTSGLLILNGFGFYYAYFKPTKTINNLYIPKSVKSDPFYIECYDNGIGRALWFYNGGNPQKIFNTISAFPEHRKPGIWAGVGLAATYAGGVSPEKILELKGLARQYDFMLGEGSVLASHTRDIAQNPHDTDITQIILTGKSAQECNDFANIAVEKLEGKRFINGEHSLKVFLHEIRSWVKYNLHDERIDNVINEIIYEK